MTTIDERVAAGSRWLGANRPLTAAWRTLIQARRVEVAA